MKFSNRILVLVLASLATDASAHAPLLNKVHGPGGGGITQNVIAGPIKHHPAKNAPIDLSGSWGSQLVELRGHDGAAYPMLHLTVVFLGAEWRDPYFVNDKIAGLNRFFSGYSGSAYSSTLKEYLGPHDGDVGQSVSYEGYVIDDNWAPAVESPGNVALRITSLADEGLIKVEDDGSSYIAVFSAHRRPTWESCGWHGWSLGGARFGYYLSFSYNLDSDSQCDVSDSVTRHSEGLAALANESARALADVQTDVRFGGWLDWSGNEVDDKCAWIFSVPYVTFPDGSKWKLQDLWSNQAYEAGTGYPNTWGQRGCVTGR